MSVKLISIRYFSDSEDSCSVPTASSSLSREHPTLEVNPNIRNTTTNASNRTTECTKSGTGIVSRPRSFYSTFCGKIRALPWSYVVLSAIIIFVASAMSLSLLIFYVPHEEKTLVGNL